MNKISGVKTLLVGCWFRASMLRACGEASRTVFVYTGRGYGCRVCSLSLLDPFRGAGENKEDAFLVCLCRNTAPRANKLYSLGSMKPDSRETNFATSDCGRRLEVQPPDSASLRSKDLDVPCRMLSLLRLFVPKNKSPVWSCFYLRHVWVQAGPLRSLATSMQILS